MWVLESQGDVLSRRPQVVVLFGSGLIGASCIKWLQVLMPWTATELPFAWEPIRDDHESQLSNHVVSSLERLRRSGLAPRLSFLWCAGKAGFGAEATETAGELANFTRVVDLATKLAAATPDVAVDFTLFSSAGGLFEGMRLVQPDTEPRPLRPYGQLKLDQEAVLKATDSRINKLILRPSSVYGPVSPAGRMGLIPVLIRNGLRRAVSTIAGNVSTQRDYVHVDDIGRYVAQVMLSESDAALRTEFLVSGCPTSILEIVRVVEHILSRKLYVNYEISASNSRDITFAAACRAPAPWATEDLATTIRQIYRQQLASKKG